MSQFLRALADVNCHYKMTSFVVLDGVTSSLPLKDVTNTCKRMRHSPYIGGIFFSAMAESWMTLKASTMFSSFIVF